RRVLVGRAGVFDHPAFGFERNRPLFLGRETQMVGEVLENVARVGRFEVHLVERYHPLDGPLPVLGRGTAIRDARHASLRVGPVARPALGPHQLALDRNALVARRLGRRLTRLRVERRRRAHAYCSQETGKPFRHGALSVLLPRHFGNSFCLGQNDSLNASCPVRMPVMFDTCMNVLAFSRRSYVVRVSPYTLKTSAMPVSLTPRPTLKSFASRRSSDRVPSVSNVFRGMKLRSARRRLRA